MSEGSCDTEDWSIDAENSALHHRNITFLKHIQTKKKVIFIPQYYCFYWIFDQIKAALLSIRIFLQIVLTPNSWMVVYVFLTVWQGTFCGFKLLVEVRLVCRCRWSTQSWRSCWLLQITCIRSIIFPAHTHIITDQAYVFSISSSNNIWHEGNWVGNSPDISKAFFVVSLSSVLFTVIPVRGSFPYVRQSTNQRILERY